MIINGGYAFKSNQYIDKEKGVRVLRISDFNENGFNNKNPVYYPFSTKLEPFLLEEGDIIMCMTGGTVGKSFFVNKLYEKMLVNQRVADIKIYERVNKQYVYSVILSSYIQKIIEESKNSTNDNISITLIESFLMPLPPLAEQERIVAEIEKYEPLIAEYEKLEQQKSKLGGEIYDKLKKSILQYAIQGKLVPQDENDEPASELLKRIREEKKAKLGKKYIDSYIYKGDDNCPYEHIDEKQQDEVIEVPFDLPDNWEWVHIRSIAEVKGGKRIPAGRQLQDENNGHIYIRVTDMMNETICTEKLKFVPSDIVPSIKNYTISKEDLYLTIAGTIGKVGIVPQYFDNMNLTENAVKICNIAIDKMYLLKVLLSSYAQNAFNDKTNKVAQPKLAIERILYCRIPIPPLAEQKRIVDKINEIFAKL